MIKAKKVRDSRTVMCEIVLPNHANTLGHLRGGKLLDWMDIAGEIAAQRHSGKEAVTASIAHMYFKKSIQVGDVVNIPVAGSVTPQEGDRVHVVQVGENLYRIGLIYGCTVEQLAQHNNLTNPDQLEVGQQVLIPSCE